VDNYITLLTPTAGFTLHQGYIMPSVSKYVFFVSGITKKVSILGLSISEKEIQKGCFKK
jgi:hypothetical protein